MQTTSTVRVRVEDNHKPKSRRVVVRVKDLPTESAQQLATELEKLKFVNALMTASGTLKVHVWTCWGQSGKPELGGGLDKNVLPVITTIRDAVADFLERYEFIYSMK